ncbi:MAG: T9SS type A sorting domain-containing protein [Bacteroidales bacterium]|nr:T9SS type A sorting domain-containing protein [Bacteroidales bacterium]
MKRHLIILAAMLIFSAVQAQDYEPIIQEGNEWHTLDVIVNPGFPPNDYYSTLVHWLSDDTLVDGVRYTKVLETRNGEGTPRLATLLREENGKVWKRKSATDILIYDFTAQVGDTLRFGDFQEFDYFVVDSISIEQIGGTDRRKFWFGLEYDFMGEPVAIETWTEGIGSDMGLLFSGWYYTTGGYYKALCFHQNEELVWQNDYYGTCMIDAVEEEVAPAVSVYPNPASETVRIEGIGPAEVQLHNALGQLVKTVENTHEINVAGLPQGVYLLRIRDEEGKVFTAKLAVK